MEATVTLGSQPKVKRIPNELCLGAVLVGAISLAGILAPWISPFDPDQQHYLLKRGAETIMSPFPPGSDYWLGSDFLGRDLLSRILWGARSTLIICGLILMARMLLGTSLGLLAGWVGGWVEAQVTMLTSWVAAFPSLLLAIVALEVLRGNRNPTMYVLALCLVGWAEIATFVKHQVQSIARAPYVEGAVAIGSGHFDILRRHVLPNLAPHLWSLAALEASSTLLLVAELGFLGYFVGGGLTVELLKGTSATSGLTLVDRIPEWGQMVGAGRERMLNEPWLLLGPGAAFALAILGLNLLGEGLRKLWDPFRS